MLRISATMTGLSGAPYFSTIYTDGTTNVQAQLASDAFIDFWDDIKGYITAGLTIARAPEVQLVDPATGDIQASYAVTGGTALSTGNAPLPKATQGLLRINTNEYVAGRRLKGRLFIPALANDAQSGGVPSATFKSAVETASGTLGAALSGAGGWAVYSRTHHTVAAVTGGSLWSQFAVLRSRRD